MVIHSEFLDSLSPSSIRSITAKIRDKAKEGIQVVSFAGGLPRSFSPPMIWRRSATRFSPMKGARRSSTPPPTDTIPCGCIWWNL